MCDGGTPPTAEGQEFQDPRCISRIPFIIRPTTYHEWAR
jgi:hypothetical protein